MGDFAGIRSLGQNSGAILAHQGEDFARGGNGLIGHRRYAVEKEIRPAFPVTLRANGVEAAVILFPVALEEQAELKEQVDEGGLRSLNLRGRHRLLAHEGVEKPIERGHQGARQIETRQRLLGGVQAFTKFGVDNERWVAWR